MLGGITIAEQDAIPDEHRPAVAILVPEPVLLGQAAEKARMVIHLTARSPNPSATSSATPCLASTSRLGNLTRRRRQSCGMRHCFPVESRHRAFTGPCGDRLRPRRLSSKQVFKGLGVKLLQPIRELVYVEHVRRESLGADADGKLRRILVQIEEHESNPEEHTQ
jgi:hypothetical protein